MNERPAKKDGSSVDFVEEKNGCMVFGYKKVI
jgi:hypothetical protein